MTTSVLRPANGNARSFALEAAYLVAILSAAFGIAICIKNQAALMRITEVPAGVLLLIAVPLAVAMACAGQMYVHRRFASADFVQHNEVGGFIIAVAGSLYAVLLGFLTSASWQHYDETRQLVAVEAAAAADAWHVAVGLPPAQQVRVRKDVLEYANLMISNEWPQMHNGGSDLRSSGVIMDAIGTDETFKPADLGQSNAQSATLQQLGVMHDQRQRRLSDNDGGISWFGWIVLTIGAVCVIGFCWMFGLANRSVHLLMTSTVTVIITSTLVLLFELQFPFRSGLGISPASWVAVINHIHWMQTGMNGYMRM